MQVKLILPFCLILLVSACQGSNPIPQKTPPSTQLTWYSTCGAPVCGNPNQPTQPNTCGGKQEGQACSVEGETCDLGNDCQQKLVCAKSDPKQQPGGCPISKPIYKQNIEFLGPLDRQQLAQQIQDMPLASWQYKFESTGHKRLGFLIDENTPPELVKPDGNSVDLYGYMTMAVAAIQEQNTRVEALEKELQSLKTQLKNCQRK